MRSKLFADSVKTEQLPNEKWVRIFQGCRLYDPLNDTELGRILVDANDNWIYDGDQLNVYEQEEIAASVLRHEKQMNQLIESIKTSEGTINMTFRLMI
jgi:hypothetical protein